MYVCGDTMRTKVKRLNAVKTTGILHRMNGVENHDKKILFFWIEICTKAHDMHDRSVERNGIN